jgi:hypothetical protein
MVPFRPTANTSAVPVPQTELKLSEKPVVNQPRHAPRSNEQSAAQVTGPAK